MLNSRVSDKNFLKELPESPGVYIFKNASGERIYVGKAKNLKSRVSSYFHTHITGKTYLMIKEARFLSFINSYNEFDAILLEANLIRKFYPKYNLELKDDKSPLYIAITKEKYPRVVRIRKTPHGDYTKIYGPFPGTNEVGTILKNIRRIVAFSSQKHSQKICLDNQIGLCSPCPAQIERERDEEKKNRLTDEYKRNLRYVNSILSGKINLIRKSLVHEMQTYSNRQDYENAQQVREKISQIDFLRQPVRTPEVYLQNPHIVSDIKSEEIDELKQILDKYFSIKKLVRIECFDVSHLSGTFPTASMVTFVNGEPDKNFYRHFRLKESFRDDSLALKEVILRRIRHLENWGKSDLVIVDGGKPQVSVIWELFSKITPVIGIAKKEETLVIKNNGSFMEIKLPASGVKNLVQRIRNEAHRFAQKYHHHLLAKNLTFGQRS